jgi:hypothetical protein
MPHLRHDRQLSKALSLLRFSENAFPCLFCRIFKNISSRGSVSSLLHSPLFTFYIFE